MQSNQQLLFRFELIWWLVTAVLVTGFVYPIYQRLPDFPFLGLNIVFIVGFITLARYVFFMRYTFFAKQRNLKIVLMFLSLPFVFIMVNKVIIFQGYLDDSGLSNLVKTLPFEEQIPWLKYVTTEMLFFGVGTAITGLIFPLRLVVSLWRVHNGYPD